MSSVDEKMTALADAIREKANASGKMTIDEMTVTVRGISVGEGDATVQTTKSATISSPSGTISPDSGYGSMSGVKYDLDATSKANLIAGNIKQGVKILGVTGNYEPPVKDTDNWCGEYNGSAYHADAIVSYQGNIYRAAKDTDNIPGQSDDWKLLNTPEVDQWCGEYNGSAYYAKSIVSYQGNIFRAITDTDNVPGVNSTDWVKLNEGTWCGEYDGSAYYANSIVSYKGNIYISTRDTDNIPGDDSGDWTLLNDVAKISEEIPTFSANGTYYAKNDGFDGYSAFTIAVPSDWRGEYDGSAYMVNSIVSYNGNVYRATKDTDNEPTHSDWVMLNTNSGGSAIETCGLTIHANGVTGTQILVPYVDDNGAIQVCSGYETLWEDHNFRVPKGSAVLFDFEFTFNYGADNLKSIENATNSFSSAEYNNNFYVITGDVEITITY